MARTSGLRKTNCRENRGRRKVFFGSGHFQVRVPRVIPRRVTCNRDPTPEELETQARSPSRQAPLTAKVVEASKVSKLAWRKYKGEYIYYGQMDCGATDFRLDVNWVEGNWQEWFLEQVRDNQKKYKFIPPGRANLRSDVRPTAFPEQASSTLAHTRILLLSSPNHNYRTHIILSYRTPTHTHTHTQFAPS